MTESEKLHAFVDGQLSEADTNAVQQKCVSCAETRGRVESIKRLKLWVTETVEPIASEPEWSRCLDRFNEIDNVDRSSAFIRRNGWALAATVAVVIGIGGWVSRTSPQSSLSSADLAGAIFSRSSPTESQQQRNFQLDSILKRADQSLRQLRPVAARRMTLNGQPAEEMRLRDSGGEIRLIVLPVASEFDFTSPIEGSKYTMATLSDSQNCIIWKTEDNTMILIGERSIPALVESATANFSAPL